jgi:hypothetical protein
MSLVKFSILTFVIHEPAAKLGSKCETHSTQRRKRNRKARRLISLRSKPSLVRFSTYAMQNLQLQQNAAQAMNDGI